MAAIRALLNPTRSTALQTGDQSTPLSDDLPRTPTPTPASTPRLLSPSPTTSTSGAYSPYASPRKRPRTAKDLPIFTRAPPRGPVRYPVYEYPNNAELAAYHTQSQLFPSSRIGDYPRHIPYNSEKRIFADQTGRDFFEVYQYTFKVTGRDETTYTMLWDYNIGLVRTTPLFKCCGYAKTTPAKMLNKNHGLRELCHSITGGSLVAQGYWIPYAAARAIATTFCYNIRHALTPVFGIDFVWDCLPPSHEKFGSMEVDSKIVQECRLTMAEYHRLQSNDAGVPILQSPIKIKRQPPKPLNLSSFKAVSALHNAVNQASDSSTSGYSTEASNVNDDDNDSYVLSPTTADTMSLRFKNVWTGGKAPRSTPRSYAEEVVSPKSKHGVLGSATRKQLTNSASQSKMKRSMASKRLATTDEDYDASSSDEMEGLEMTESPNGESLRWHGGSEQVKVGKEEEEAAKALLSLWLKQESNANAQDVVASGLDVKKTGMKRPASA